MFLIYKKVKSLFLNRDSLKEKPLRTIFYLIIVLFANILRLKIKYKANLKKSFFIYTYKPYFNTGVGGTGQFILREYYDEKDQNTIGGALSFLEKYKNKVKLEFVHYQLFITKIRNWL